MEPHEILPEPVVKNNTEQLEQSDGFNEARADIAVEHKKGSSTGSAAIAGMAVDDASSQVQASQVASVIGGTASSGVIIDTPEVAEDLDLIEKAWVQKAKEIVMQTQGDPYTQNKRISGVKIDYIKKRYGKEIRSSEGQ
jgi:hypothetical protein